jgi:hypothetical protein
MVPEGYCDDWDATDQHPSKMFYESLPSTVGNENSYGGKLQLGLSPGLQVEMGRKIAHTQHQHTVVDFQKSEFHEFFFWK